MINPAARNIRKYSPKSYSWNRIDFVNLSYYAFLPLEQEKPLDIVNAMALNGRYCLS